MLKRKAVLLTVQTKIIAFASCKGNDTDTVSARESSDTQIIETKTSKTEDEVIVSSTEDAETTTRETKTETKTTKKTETDDLGPLFKEHVADKISDGSYTVKFKQLGVRLITTIDKNNSVIESDASGVLRITLINKDGRYFMVVPTTKKYVEIAADEYAKQVESFGDISVSFEGIRLIDSGKETIGGVAYNTETYDEGDRGVVTYYFTDKGLKKLKSQKDGKVNDVETFEISSEIDVSVFDIPKGYTKVSDPAQVLVP